MSSINFHLKLFQNEFIIKKKKPKVRIFIQWIGKRQIIIIGFQIKNSMLKVHLYSLLFE